MRIPYLFEFIFNQECIKDMVLVINLIFNAFNFSMPRARELGNVVDSCLRSQDVELRMGILVSHTHLMWAILSYSKKKIYVSFFGFSGLFFTPQYLPYHEEPNQGKCLSGVFLA